MNGTVDDTDTEYSLNFVYTSILRITLYEKCASLLRPTIKVIIFIIIKSQINTLTKIMNYAIIKQIWFQGGKYAEQKRI